MAVDAAAGVIEGASARLQKAAAPVDTREFHTLDGMRGVAALAVGALHMPSFTHASWFGDDGSLQCAFLGVDMFFVLSGFVIAHAYERRLASGMALSEFLKLRTRRLGPLYFLGVVVAIVQMTAARVMHPNAWNAVDLVLAGLTALLVIPIPLFGFKQVMYPLNPATWTLLAELLVNFLYAGVVRWLTTPRLVGLCMVAGLGLAWVGWRYGSIDRGIMWFQFPTGMIRAVFGFFAGVLMLRLYRSRPPTGRSSGWLWMGLLGVLLLLPLRGAWLAPYEVACALVIFPLLIYAAAGSVVGPRGQRVCATAGTVSYALYVLHTPLGRLAALVSDLMKWDIANDVANAALMVILVVMSWLADAFYDRPVRRWLKRIDRPGRPQPA